MKTLPQINDLNTEKCVEMIGNRFDLVLVASQRARELRKGHRSTLNSASGTLVTALREIQSGLVGPDYLKRIK